MFPLTSQNPAFTVSHLRQSSATVSLNKFLLLTNCCNLNNRTAELIKNDDTLTKLAFNCCCIEAILSCVSSDWCEHFVPWILCLKQGFPSDQCSSLFSLNY